ncbi:uncharacterized protein LOC141912156 [Tubulanus polymorphus]|uniref:uncharacterized protein LOC141912156 n=1 Tax=Tubulanus polymorphus TaxID=672921 RepID=UPI003DA4B202
MLVMELVSDEDCTLRHVIRNNKLSKEKLMFVCMKIAKGLAFLHGEKILHNDLHDNNILVPSTLRVKIIDFGSATLTTNPRKYYLSPAERDIYNRKHSHIGWELRNVWGAAQSAASDMYSFGRILKVLVTLCGLDLLKNLSNACRDRNCALRPSAQYSAEQIEICYSDPFRDSDLSESDENEENLPPAISSGLKRKRVRPIGSTKKAKTTHLKNLSNDKSATRCLIPVNKLCSTHCCDEWCLAEIPLQKISDVRSDFQSLKMYEQKQFILDYLLHHSIETDTDSLNVIFTIGAFKTCSRAWMLALGIKKSRYYSIKREFTEGSAKSISPPGISRSGSFTSASQVTMAWLREYCEKFADKLPNQEKLHLPSCLTKGDVFRMCEEELGTDNVCSESHFYHLWRNHFENVSIPKVGRFSKCDKCVKVKDLLQATKNKKKRKKVLKYREKHLRQQNVERQKYYKHAEKARKNPAKYMSLIIDGMDQAKTFIPHFSTVPKSISSAWRMKTHVTGVILHGRQVYGFFDKCEYPHSGNLTMNIILNILFLHKEDLPPTLYLQMDNCWRDNKNRFVFAFLHMLVQMRIFDKIKVSFLMVGHTHEDIDQLFSRFSTYLNRHDAITMQQLMSAFEACDKKHSPVGIEIDHCYNISSWLSEEIEKISFHSKPHVFKISRDANGQAKMTTKKWSTDRVWIDCDGDKFGHLLRKIPSGVPDMIKPNFDNIEFNRLRSDVERAFKFMANEDRSWWKKYLEELELRINEDGDPYEFSDMWMLGEIDEAVKNKLKQCEAENDADDDTDDGLSDLSDDDSPIPRVVIGKKSGTSTVKDVEREMVVGDLCLLDMAKYADYWPQIGEVIEINDEVIKLRWYKGGLTGKIEPEVLFKKGNGKIDWIEEVSRPVIWKWGFKLTPKGYLTTEIKACINAYADF